MRATNRAWRRGLVALAVLVVTVLGTVATTQASVPKSSTHERSATQRSATQPSATQPSATQPSATQASTSKSSGIQPGSVVGTATGTLPEWFGPMAGDRVRFDLDAHGDPMRTTGTFRVFHGVGTSGEARAEFEGNITCLTVAGPVAIATGVVTDGYVRFPGIDPDVTGKKVSFTVLDQGGRDRMYWAWEFFHAPINDCQGLAPMFRPGHSDFRVRTDN